MRSITVPRAAVSLKNDMWPHWYAWFAGAAVAAMSVLFWQNLNEHEYLHRESAMQEVVNDLKEAFIVRIVGHIGPLMRIKGRWEREGEMSDASWRAMANGIMQEHESLAAIVHIGSDYRVNRLQPRAETRSVEDVDGAISVATSLNLAGSRRSESMVATDPAVLTDRGLQFMLINPVYVDGEFDGFVGASLSYEPLARALIEAGEKKGFAVSFRHGDREVLTSSQRVVDGHQVELAWPFMTQMFSVTARPLASAAATGPGLAEIVLAAGLLVALALTIAVGSATKARLRLAKSEEEYRMTFENAPVAICRVSQEGRYLQVNRAFEELLGYSLDDLAQIVPEDTVHPKSRDEAKHMLNDLFAGRRSTVNIELQRIRKDGRAIWTQISGKMLRDNYGERYLLSHLQDITARKHAEEQLFQSQKMEALGNLAGGIAHDFNNMLLPIIALTEISQSELPADSPVQENLGSVLEAAYQASHLVRQILTFSRQNEKTVEPLDISECISEAFRLLRNVLPSSITVCDKIAPGVGVVLGDRAQLISVLMNLGSNAKHAMKGGVGKLRVGLGRTVVGPELAARMPKLSGGAAYAAVEVLDTGCGMHRATLEKIFNPFFTTKEVGEGTGLGLAMVHGIIEGLGGAISVASEVGVGSTFTIYLPLKSAANEEPERELAAA